MAIRSVAKVVTGRETSDGAGVRLRRSIGGPDLEQADPFLLLDEFRSDDSADYIGGFPDHPHRGFETVTYMLAGAMRHSDHVGNKGHLRAGSVQWMTAGRGIIHSEMPEQENGLLWGFQLWVNLPGARKMDPPRYQDIPPDQVPELREKDGSVVRVVAGRYQTTLGPVQGVVTDPTYLDVTLAKDRAWTTELPAAHTVLAYVFEGSVSFGPATPVFSGTLAVLGPGDSVGATAGSGGARFLLLAARPLGEPVARYGPFVMTTRGEIQQAIDDYRAGRLLS